MSDLNSLPKTLFTSSYCFIERFRKKTRASGVLDQTEVPRSSWEGRKEHGMFGLEL